MRPFILPALLFITSLAGCTHIHGVVLTQPGERPHKTAVLSIGRPGGIAVIEPHPVNKQGIFDFYVPAMDQSNVYLFDSESPEATTEHIDSSELSENMKLHLRPPAADPFSGMPVP